MLSGVWFLLYEYQAATLVVLVPFSVRDMMGLKDYNNLEFDIHNL